MSNFVSGIISAFVFLLFPMAAFACSCSECSSPVEANKSFGVFQYIMTAKILASVDYDKDEMFMTENGRLLPLRQVLLSPETISRGKPKDWVLVYDEACSFGGEVGDVVRIAAYLGEDGQLHASNCSAICAEEIGHSFRD